MEKEVLKRIFDFLEGKENCNPPFLWKVKSKIQLTEKDLNVKGDLDLFDSKIKSLPKQKRKPSLSTKLDMQQRLGYLNMPHR